jgi:Zn-dependent protease with chaperone function
MRTIRVAPSDPINYLSRRFAGLIVVGAALLGTLAAAAGEAVGLPHEVTMAVGIGAFGLLSVAGTLAAPWSRSVEPRSDRR